MGEKLNGDFEIEPKIFNKILVAVDEDDSQSSINAFNYAVTTAKRLNISLGESFRFLKSVISTFLIR